MNNSLMYYKQPDASYYERVINISRTTHQLTPNSPMRRTANISSTYCEYHTDFLRTAHRHITDSSPTYSEQTNTPYGERPIDES
ncbi:hypothetical protein CDAR_542381 [Caerostris darwini]|uniref:Uncharacterized protein n=1 Tax=Caerostris darwini TaxID=1538125 RepID=A0AAV4ML05_9ARAC|nr:hypothetical protein CDAR_542381 [Caerostris darwini]